MHTEFWCEYLIFCYSKQDIMSANSAASFYMSKMACWVSGEAKDSAFPQLKFQAQRETYLISLCKEFQISSDMGRPRSLSHNSLSLSKGAHLKLATMPWRAKVFYEISLKWWPCQQCCTYWHRHGEQLRKDMFAVPNMQISGWKKYLEILYYYFFTWLLKWCQSVIYKHIFKTYNTFSLQILKNRVLIKCLKRWFDTMGLKRENA